MEVTQLFEKHSRIMFDTAPIIYFIEEHKDFGAIMDDMFKLIIGNPEYHAFSSTITITEVLVQPLRQIKLDIVKKYRKFLLSSTDFLIYPVDSLIAEKAAELRAQYEIRTPDAIQLATAIENKGTLFVTNDTRLKRVKEVEILIIGEYS